MEISRRCIDTLGSSTFFYFAPVNPKRLGHSHQLGDRSDPQLGHQVVAVTLTITSLIPSSVEICLIIKPLTTSVMTSRSRSRLGLRVRDGTRRPLHARHYQPADQALGARAGLAFPVPCTCCVMAAATPWPMPGTTRERSRIGSAIGRFGTTVRFTELSPTRFRDDGVARHKGLVRAVSSPYAMQDRADHQIVCSRRALCCYAAALGMEKVGLTFVQLAFTLVSAYLSLFVACSAILYFLHCSKRNLAAGFSITTRQMNVPYWFRGVIQIRPQETR
jgi:hypothetical protein